MTTDLKIGDMVRVVGGSWAVCVSKEWNEETQHDIIHPHIGLSTEPFEVVYVREVWEGLRVPHDIFIQSTFSDQVYLHSSNMVERVEAEWFKGAKRGDRFYINDSEYILSHFGGGRAALINTATGNCKRYATQCFNILFITKKEFIEIVGSSSAKEVYATKH